MNSASPISWTLLTLLAPIYTAHATTIAHWNFEEGQDGTVASGSGTILDQSGNGLHGTPLEGPHYRAVPYPGSNLALEFDGAGDRVFIPDDPRLALTGSLTLEARIRLDALPSGQVNWAQIVFRGDSRAGLDPYQLAILNIPGHPNHGKLAFEIKDSADVLSVVYSPQPIVLGQTYHVAGTIDDATGVQALFINGVQVASNTTSTRPFGPLSPTWNPGVGIGNVQDSLPEYFSGIIDEVRISDVSLSPDQFLPEPSTLILSLIGSWQIRRRGR